MSMGAPKGDVGWKYSAVGIPGTRSHATTTYEDPVTRDKANARLAYIQWKTILLDLVQTLGGSDPMYKQKETLSTLFQSSVRFRLPLKKDEGLYEDIEAVGMKCFTAWEAESEASAAALSKLQWGAVRTRVVDVSSVRCMDMEKLCNEVLSQAGKLLYALKAILVDWDDNMSKVEGCYIALKRKAAHGVANRAGITTGEIIADVADRLFALNKAAYTKHVKLARDSEEVKTLLIETHERVNLAFRDLSNDDEARRYRRDLPGNVKVRMKLILEEMMNSLGWARPAFDIVCSETGLYICEVFLVPLDCYGRVCGRKISAIGLEALSEAEAVESSCEAAILFLEKEMDIYLVDLNYADRLDGKHYVSESKDVVYNIRLIGSKVLDEWKRMAREILFCRDYYKNLPTESNQDRLRTEAEFFESHCAVAVDALYSSSVASLELAEKRFNNVILWIGIDTWTGE